LKENSKIFKIAMYGGLRDLKFINRLNKMKSIDELEKEGEVIQGMGLIKDSGAIKKGNPHIRLNKFIEVGEIYPYYTPVPNKKLEEHPNYLLHRRSDKKNLYSAPLILFKEGTKDGD